MRRTFGGGVGLRRVGVGCVICREERGGVSRSFAF